MVSPKLRSPQLIRVFGRNEARLHMIMNDLSITDVFNVLLNLVSFRIVYKEKKF